MREITLLVSNELGLTEAERAEEIPSGGTRLISNRVHWAKTYLKQAGLVEQPQRGVVQISPRGREVLGGHPQRLDVEFLRRFEEFRVFLNRRREDANGPAAADPLAPAPLADAAPLPLQATPEDQIAQASATIEAALRDDVLARVLEASPAFFERLILDLLLAMGYGGSREDAGRQLGRSGDGGVDGVIHEDPLGLDRIYLQAKRYAPGNPVGSEAVQAFMGALVGRGAHKGVLITTSSFTRAALAAAQQSLSMRLILIDGEMLTALMLRHNVGVRIARTVEIKDIHLDYFESADMD